MSSEGGTSFRKDVVFRLGQEDAPHGRLEAAFFVERADLACRGDLLESLVELVREEIRGRGPVLTPLAAALAQFAISAAQES